MNYKYENVEYEKHFPVKIFIHDYIGNRIYTPQHWHRSLELLYVTEGRFLSTVNGQKKIVKADEISFVNSQEVHVLDCDRPSDILRASCIIQI